MRTPEEILDEHKIVRYRDLIGKLISEAQKEAWNEAIEQAAESIITDNEYERSLQDSILKLKK